MVYSGPCVLVVDELPTRFSGVCQALITYIKNVTKGVSPLSCVVDGKQAILKFEDDQGIDITPLSPFLSLVIIILTLFFLVAKQLVQVPPTTPFLGSALTFTTRPDPHPSSHYHKSSHVLRHQASDPVTYKNMETSLPYQSGKYS